MKSFKKALAVMLSVLMVVLSFPFSAMALENPNIGDGNIYNEDQDVVMHLYAMPYVKKDLFGPAAGVYNEAGDDYDPGKTYDFNNITKADIAADFANCEGASSLGHSTFCLVVTMENMNPGYNMGQFYISYDTSVVTPAYYKTNLAKGYMTGASASPLREASYWLDGMNAETTCARSLPDGNTYVATEIIFMGTDFGATTLWEDTVAYEMPGQVVAVVGFELLQDSADLSKVFTLSQQYDKTFWTMDTEDPGNNWTQFLNPYGAYDENGAFDPSKNTMFTCPELGLAPAETSKDVTYTYTFADGHSTTVKAAEGTEPTAPANTADAIASNGDGTHTTTTYSWPAFAQGTTAYTEVATPSTVPCTKVVDAQAVAPGHETPGSTEAWHCSVCNYTVASTTVGAAGHTWDAGVVTPATCTAQGYTTYTCTAGDGGTMVSNYTDPDPNNHTAVVTDAAVPATCTSKGLTEGSHCEACGAIVDAQTETPINPKNHTNVVKDDAVDPTCTDPGRTEGSHCADCGTVIVAQKTIEALGHAWDAGVITKEATRAEDGVKTYTCTRDASHKKTEAIPALGVQITVTANELGTTTLNGVPTTGSAQKVPYESTYTLKATANEGAEFVGWMVNGKMVSTNAVYTTGAYADLTYIPVFAPKATVDFVVTFIDQFNKVIATISSSELAGLTKLPSAPDYPHYTFEGYDLTLDEVKALTDSKVVTASYTKDETTYTVNAIGCTITVDGRDYNETATVSHDARVTVKPNSSDVAKSWTVNSSQAAFGSEYSFYVTADVEVAYSTLDVTAAPTVANVSMDQIDDVKVRFLATRSVTDGYTLLESGFVYGKDMNSADLVLENVNGTTCRVMKNSNMAADGQFALTVGIASKTGKIGVAAYIIVKDSAGTVSAIYAPVQEWTYN